MTDLTMDVQSPNFSTSIRQAFFDKASIRFPNGFFSLLILKDGKLKEERLSEICPKPSYGQTLSIYLPGAMPVRLWNIAEENMIDEIKTVYHETKDSDDEEKKELYSEYFLQISQFEDGSFDKLREELIENRDETLTELLNDMLERINDYLRS